MENILQEAVNFDPVLVAAFAGLAMMITQILKDTVPIISRQPKVAILTLSIIFAILVIFDQDEVLSGAVITFLIMSAANGVYSSSKTKTEIPEEMPDFSDES